MRWLPMTTCPEGRPVFVKYGREIFERVRVGDEIRILDNPATVAGRIADRYDGWHPCHEWRTDKAPRTGEWLQVTWGDQLKVRVRWIAIEGRWVDANNKVRLESWLAWMHDLPDFILLPKPPTPVDDLAGKSVDELLTEIKRLTEHLVAVWKEE